MRYYNKNAEGYADPTAGAAIANIRRVELKEKRVALRKERKKKHIQKTIIKEDGKNDR